MENIIELDRRYIWHPFTNLKKQDQLPLKNIVRGEGFYVYDEDGNKYMDAIGSWWSSIHGHRHPRIVKAIKEQLDILDHIHFAGNTHKWAVELAKRILEILGNGFTKAFYSDDGSTAVEVALKIAYQYFLNKEEERNLFISLSGAYHGDTIGSIALGNIDEYHKIFKPFIFKTIHIPAPYCYRCPVGKKKGNCNFECLDNLIKVLKENKGKIAGIFIEPLFQGASGFIVYPKEYLEQLYNIVKDIDKDILIIFDEVATGFGRTGEMFAFKHLSFSPDIIALAKGLGGGPLTIGMTCVKDFIYQTFENGKYPYLYHGHTYTANPIVARSGIESLNIFEEENLIDKVKEKSKYFRKKIFEYFSDLKFVGDIRQIGLIGALELIYKDGKRDLTPEENWIVYREVYKTGFKYGVMLRPLWNVVYFIPYLHITYAEIDKLFEATRKTLIEVYSNF